MRSLIRSTRQLSSVPVTIREMAPQFQFLTSSTPPASRPSDMKPLFAEVLRCHSYFDERVFANVRHLLTTKESGSGTNAEGTRLHKMRYLAVVYHSMIDDAEKRNELRNLAEHAERCKVPMLRNDQELFFQSMFPSEHVPDFKKCLHKNELIFCYFRRELTSGNWNNVQKLVIEHPNDVDLYANIDRFLDVAKKNPLETLRIFMEFSQKRNPYFLNLGDFETVFKKVAKCCSARISECNFDGKKNRLVSKSGKILKTSKTYIKDADLALLKQRIDGYVKGNKEGLVKTKEFQAACNRVVEWKKKRKLTNGNDVVVVDALNFGGGLDPKKWDDISRQFKHVVFATKMPPMTVRERVLKRYKGNVVFCDSQSADDLIILRMALEFGPETSLVTNDRYRDHRLGICAKDMAVQKIWDDFMTDAVYRHDKEDMESRRDFNLRITNSAGVWFVPVLNDDSEMLRNPKVYCVETVD